MGVPHWESLGWNDLWDLTAELMREPSSHLMSVILGDKYVPDPAERAAWAVFELWANTQKRGIRITRPWSGTRPSYRAEPSDVLTDAAKLRREKLSARF